jgi:hypothetical protein
MLKIIARRGDNGNKALALGDRQMRPLEPADFTILLDKADLTILIVLSFTAGLVIGLMFIPAIRPRRRHYHLRHSGTFSGASLLMSKVDLEPIDIIQSRHHASTGVDDAALRTPETSAVLDSEKAASNQRDAAPLGVDDSAQPIGADVKIDLAWH